MKDRVKLHFQIWRRVFKTLNAQRITFGKIRNVRNVISGMWSSVFDTIYTQVHLSSQLN